MMNEQSIRDELADLIPLGFREQDGVRNVVQAADRILASSVIRRIQAEATRRASRELEYWINNGGPTPGKSFLDRLADRIERGDADV